MSQKSFMRRAAVVACGILTVSAVMTFGGAKAIGGITGRLLDQTGCTRCPVCDHTCKLKAERVEDDKTCFNIETKTICIPRVVFPWQTAKKAACDSCDSCDGKGCSACVHNGARLRTVRVLKADKYKCPACKYTWSAEPKGCCDTTGGCDVPATIDEHLAAPLPEPIAEPQAQPIAPITAIPLPSAE